MFEGSTRKKSAMIGIAGVVLVLSALFAIGIGSVSVNPIVTLQTLLGNGDETSSVILLDIRVPRVILALIVGANLAISGALLQAVVQNPLADPGVTGVSSGAATAALFIMLVMPQSSFFVPVAAIAGGLIAAAMVYAMAWQRSIGFQPVRIILSGVAVNAIFGGLMGLLQLLYSDRLPAAVQWMNGSLAGKDMGDVWFILPYSVAGWIFALLCIRKINILRLGEQTAHNLGQNMNRVRLILSVLAVFLAAISVSMVGLVGFVGLVVPHISRMLIGSDFRFSLPFSILLGAIMLLIADMIGRSLFGAIQIPAGIVMAMIGGPYFLYLMRKGGA
ncbi:FecCD family ABC transporter permease [Paenibacillus endoradicis]|uniref:FecCD family ABC transporter permease n=1 Tax=Paenibacillus endoradicis TaxID=2972487 RepID=UPI002158A661|nr:iron ABC transporter permease [Paenibacillus endoradicis]MCR8658868.1 iron ABC transporter permease [Paenibacillus endoradicis]